MAAILLAACAVPTGIAAQALAGTYTCANGNPGGGFDYGDIGDFFDDLETLGISASVALELYDDGGAFTSSTSYQLGFDGDAINPVPRPVAGLGFNNRLSIRAAPGESPRVIGGGAGGVSPATTISHTRGCMFFYSLGYTSVEGIEFIGGDFGIHWYCPTGGEYIRVAKCKIHGLSGSVALGIAAGDDPYEVHNVVIENNAFWDCTGPTQLGLAAWGVVCAVYNGSQWRVRNNTIVHISSTGWGWDAFNFWSNRPLEEFSGNIVHLDHVDPMQVFNAVKPLQADRNVVYMGGQAKMSWGSTDWALWQSWGFDANGVNADPLLVSVSPGQEDLRLLPGSPARDLIPSSALTEDAFGNTRPFGAGYDSGAHEFSNFPAEAAPAAGSRVVVSAGGHFDVTVTAGSPLVGVAIELTDAEGDAITVSAITPPTPAVSGINTPAIPTPGHPILLEWTGVADPSTPPGTYTWTVNFTDSGSGYPRACVVRITILPPPKSTDPPSDTEDSGCTLSSAPHPYTPAHRALALAALVLGLAAFSLWRRGAGR